MAGSSEQGYGEDRGDSLAEEEDIARGGGEEDELGGSSWLNVDELKETVEELAAGVNVEEILNLADRGEEDEAVE
ncbi:hypothetical protein BDZ91DRAFT_800098 [Kalaharituber pfeilii]|nr:hypothetical protein BDZ91DRAFT_800098 [Kalaharituber pfeilii]